MLVDIKIELSNIVCENNKLAKEMAGLRNTIQEQKVELDSLESFITKAEIACEQAPSEVGKKFGERVEVEVS